MYTAELFVIEPCDYAKQELQKLGKKFIRLTFMVCFEDSQENRDSVFNAIEEKFTEIISLFQSKKDVPEGVQQMTKIISDESGVNVFVAPMEETTNVFIFSTL